MNFAKNRGNFSLYGLLLVGWLTLCSGFRPISRISSKTRVEMASSPNLLKGIQTTASILLLSAFTFCTSSTFAKDKPSLEQYFRIVERESTEKPSLTRLSEDIEQGKWDDAKKFTREFGEGFKNAVLKEISKQLPEEKKKTAKELSESFLNDVIQINKASRIQSKENAYEAIKLVETDLNQFLLLEKE